ncbi:hypothetical protein LCGC14_1534020 [marine sediment metagenome]|uniref:SprT-like domain-containing protein n=1 Tax=marine sediment metagenome TaxID=412755 RepID=A0A0F9IV60_9ZZZZ
MVDQKLQERVAEKIRECLDIAEQRFDRSFQTPEISYKLRGLVAGQANSRLWRIRINSILLQENTDDMLNSTVPHEVAHLIADKVYGHIRSHGAEWKSVMRLLGISPNRCHRYDTTNSRVKVNVKHKFCYKCNCRDMIIVGPVRHRKMQSRFSMNKNSGYRCCSCKGYLVFVKPLGQVTYEQARDGKTKRPTKKYHVLKKGSKMERALHIYKENQFLLSRITIICLFMTTLGMSKAGATTYYYNCQKRAA